MTHRILLAALAALLIAPGALAQDHGMGHQGGDHDGHHMERPPMRANDGPRASSNAGVMQTIGTTTVMVHYGRPSVNDREVFGGLVPYDAVWRTGANEAATVTFSGPALLGDAEVPAGTYSLFTIPGESEWTVILNGVAEQWGAFGYDASQDVARTTVAPVAAATPQEQFQISFESVSDDGAVMVLAWDDVRVPVTISVTE